MEPWMHDREIAMLTQYLTPSATVLEWGSGGSTVTFAPRVKHWYAIEHNPEWYAKVAEATKAMPNVTIVNVPPDTENPPRPSILADWQHYANAFTQFNTKFDVVFIDGRARPECAAAILPYLNPGAVVVIHDFFQAGREHYRAVFDHYDVVESIEDTIQTMIVLKPKQQG